MSKADLLMVRHLTYHPHFKEYLNQITFSEFEEFDDEIDAFVRFFKWRWVYKLFRIEKKFWLNRLSMVIELLQDIRQDPEDAFELMLKKNIDYGSEQLLLTGTRGIAARITDKICRLKHLIKNDKKSILGEPYDDGIIDWFNYCILALLLIDGKLE